MMFDEHLEPSTCFQVHQKFDLPRSEIASKVVLNTQESNRRSIV